MSPISIMSFSKKMPLARRQLFLLVWAFVACTPLLGQTRLGLHYTQEELNVWKQRAGITAGTTMYKDPGDVQTYSPGDWSRITTKANQFLNNTSNARINDRYDSYYTGSGCVPNLNQAGYLSTQDPVNDGIYLRDAAFYHLVTSANPSTATSYSLAVKDELLNHIANDLNLQFNNTTRWCPGGLGDLNPGFPIAEWLTRLLYSYDYIKGTLTPGERTTLDNWFFEAAKYMQSNYETGLNGKFVNSPGGDYTLTAGTEATPGTVLYFNGPATRPTSRMYSNRRLTMISFVGLTGVFLKDVSSLSTTSLRDNSKRFFTEFIRYGIYPTGYFVDFLRGIEDSSVDKGYGYSTNGAMIAMADAFARIGDLDLLYNYQNQGGLTTAQVGNVAADATSNGTLKGLKMHMKAMLDLRNHQATVYATDYGILYNTTANATPPPSSVPYTATSATGGWTSTAAGAQTTAIRRASSSYPWTTSYGILYNTSASASLPATTVAYTATSATGGWTNNPTGALKKCFRTNLETEWVREFSSPPTGTNLIRQSIDPNYRVDGVDAILGGYSVTDVMYSVANLYYRDNYIRDSYTRVASGSVAYPQNAQNSGSQVVWGSLGQYPGILFMFGQMENDPANPFLPPTVSITAPSNNATYASPAAIILTATAQTAAGGSVNRVEFYEGSTLLGTDNASPYTITWNTTALGAHAITAKAITNVGISTTSGAITVTVGPAMATYEAESIYTVSNDGTPANISQMTCTGTLSNTKGVQLVDAADAIQLPFTISQGGTYRLGVRVRSGYSSSSTAYFGPGGYSFTVNGGSQTFTGDLSTLSTLSSCQGNSYWGTMYSGNLTLSAGSNNIVVTNNGSYRGVDYITVEFVSSGARMSYEIADPSSTVTLYPNPFEDKLTVDLGENASGTYQVAVVDVLGLSYYSREHQVEGNHTQLSLQLPGKTMKSGLYLLQLHKDGSSAPKVLKIMKR